MILIMLQNGSTLMQMVLTILVIWALAHIMVVTIHQHTSLHMVIHPISAITVLWSMEAIPIILMLMRKLTMDQLITVSINGHLQWE